MTALEHCYAPLEIRGDGDGRTVAGIALPYNEITHNSPVGIPEVFRPGAFKRSIRHRKGQSKLHRNHDIGAPLALASVTDTADAVLIEARLADTALGDEALREVRAKLLDAFSVGFSAVRERIVDGTREILEAAWHEVSLVSMPAYAGARVTSLRSNDPARIEIPPRPEVWTGDVVIAGVRWG